MPFSLKQPSQGFALVSGASLYLKCIISKVVVFSPADVGLVVGLGHIYDDAVRAFHDDRAHHNTYRPRYCQISRYERHPLCMKLSSLL